MQTTYRYRFHLGWAAAVAMMWLGLATPARAVITGATRIANAGQAILTATADPTDPDRLYVAGRGGDILLLDLASGQFNPTPFLTVPGVNDLGSEGGLLGLALHPDFASNGLGYAHYTTTGGAFGNGVSRIASFQRNPSNPDRALPGVDQLLAFSQPQGNHNAGWIDFSPNDGYLYIASGDGGGGNDSGSGHTFGTGNALDLTNNLLGKVLRIDVDSDDFPADPNRNYAIPADNPFVGVTGDDEIWAYGLRNPFRNSFDRETGDLWIADVGQNFREEINFQPADSAGGENYGWRLREGTIATPTGGVGGQRPPGAVDPVYDYLHGFGALQGNSVTGGYVYRGPDPSLNGDYFFADFVSNNYWSFDPDDPDASVRRINNDLFGSGSQARGVVSFAEDAEGNLYFLTIGGDIWRIDTSPAGDYDGDGSITSADFDTWVEEFGTRGDSPADGNLDGVVNAADYAIWRDALADQAGSVSVPEPSASLIALSCSAWLIASSIRRPLQRV